MHVKRCFGRCGILMMTVLLALSLVSCSFSSAKSNHNIDLSLESFKNNDEYQYEEIEWELSIDDVIDTLSYLIIRDEARSTVSDNINVDFYKSKNHFILDEQNSVASFEFQNEKLMIVKFDFTLDDGYQQWFDIQIEKLIKIYGKENEKTENSNEQFETISYKWETDSTMLQAILVTGDTTKPAVTIGVCIKP